MSASYVLWKTTRHKEADVMNTKDNREDNIKLTQIADLTVSEDLAAEVKGGPRGGGIAASNAAPRRMILTASSKPPFEAL